MILPTGGIRLAAAAPMAVRLSSSPATMLATPSAALQLAAPNVCGTIIGFVISYAVAAAACGGGGRRSLRRERRGHSTT